MRKNAIEFAHVACYDMGKGSQRSGLPSEFIANVLHQPSLLRVVAAIFFCP